MASKPFVWTNSRKLQWFKLEPQHVAGIKKFKGGDMMGVALADLATGRAYGYNETKFGYAASLTKIAAMYAAFQLQAAMRKVTDIKGITLDKLRDRLKGEWGPEIKRILGANAKGDFPDLGKIFLDKGWEFNQTFMDQMSDMIGYSKNEAAAYCIRALGFDYLAASLIYGGFFDVASGTGLWLSGDFVGGYVPGVDGKPAPGSEKKIKEPSQRHQVATAAAVTLLMVNIGNDELISSDATLVMKSMMFDSYASRQNDKKPFHGGGTTIHGKIGIQPNNVSFHDTAIVTRNCMDYTMTVLFMPDKFDFGLFTYLDQIADDVFKASKQACEAKSMKVKAL